MECSKTAFRGYADNLINNIALIRYRIARQENDREYFRGEIWRRSHGSACLVELSGKVYKHRVEFEPLFFGSEDGEYPLSQILKSWEGQVPDLWWQESPFVCAVYDEPAGSVYTLRANHADVQFYTAYFLAALDAYKRTIEFAEKLGDFQATAEGKVALSGLIGSFMSFAAQARHQRPPRKVSASA